MQETKRDKWLKLESKKVEAEGLTKRDLELDKDLMEPEIEPTI